MYDLKFIGMNIKNTLRQRAYEVKPETSDTFTVDDEYTWLRALESCLDVLDDMLKESDEVPIVNMNSLDEMEGEISYEDLCEYYC